MKILVTGANGLLGSKLGALLLNNSAIDTVLTGRRGANTPGNYINLDITNREAVVDLITAHKPDVVINTAAMTNVDECETKREACWEVNVKGVENLLAACAKANANFIHVSTDFVFDGSNGPLDENAIPNPVNYYGESKLAAENLVIQSNVRWAILRTVLVYGVSKDMSRSNIVLWVKDSLEKKKPIRVVNDQWRTPTLAEDLAMGCYLAAAKKAEGVFHISGEEMMTPYEIAIRTAAFFGLDSSLITATDGSQFRQAAARPPRTGFIINKAKNVLGYNPHRFDNGLSVVAQQLMEAQLITG